MHKHVAVRFTLDDWQATSKVRAKHVVSVLSLPWEVSKTKTLGDAVSGGIIIWARIIRLHSKSFPPKEGKKLGGLSVHLVR